MFLVDTNVVSNLVGAVPDDNVRRWANLHMRDAAISSIAIFELHVGAARLPDGRRKDELFGVLNRLITRFGPRIYNFDRSCAEMAAELCAASERRGQQMSRGDAQIAGIAGVYGLTLVTRNISDFAATGLDLVNPWDS